MTVNKLTAFTGGKVNSRFFLFILLLLLLYRGKWFRTEAQRCEVHLRSFILFYLLYVLVNEVLIFEVKLNIVCLHRLLQSIVMEPSSLPTDTLDSVSVALPFFSLFNIVLAIWLKTLTDSLRVLRVCIMNSTKPKKINGENEFYVVEISIIEACPNRITLDRLSQLKIRKTNSPF